MPKLSNITAAQITEAREKAEDMIHDLNAMTSRLAQGYCDPIPEHAHHARTFISLARAAAEMASLLMMQGAMQELKAKTAASAAELAREKAKAR